MLKYPVVKLLLIISLVALLTLEMYGFNVPTYSYVVLVLLGVLIVMAGSYFIHWQFFLKSFNKGSGDSNLIALTFDDGPSEDTTLEILDILDRYEAKATFFCIGKQLNANGPVAKEIIERGHSIGNHTYLHKNNFPMMSTRQMIEEIEKTNSEIEKITGLKNRFFRPPFGVTNPRIARAVKQTQMDVIGWNIRSFDTVSKNVGKVVDRIICKLKPGSIVLLHDTHQHTPAILEKVLQHMKGMKLKSVGIETLLNSR